MGEMTKDKINEIIGEIVKIISPKRFILFGSQSTNKATEESDIDLVIIWNTSMNFFERNIQIRRLFTKRNFALDVFVFTPEEEEKFRNIKGTILHKAFNEGKILYERK
jgi:predicted nucleotidyltransferase